MPRCGESGARRCDRGTRARPAPASCASSPCFPVSLSASPREANEGTRRLGGDFPFPLSRDARPRFGKGERPGRLVREPPRLQQGAGAGLAPSLGRDPAGPGARRLTRAGWEGPRGQSARGCGRRGARRGLFACCRPRRPSCRRRLLGAIPGSLIEVRLREGVELGTRCATREGRGRRPGERRGSREGRKGARSGKGTRGAEGARARREPLRGGAAGTAILKPGGGPPGRRMRGSRVTSSGSQSPIFLVMFLNGRIHYAGTRE